MRTPQEFRDLIQMVLVEEINRADFAMIQAEPENVLPKFIEEVSNRLSEVCQDELVFRRKY